jgi:hydrogenase-4 component F
MREQPWAAPFLILALGVAFASILIRVLPMVFGDSHLKPLAHPPALIPVFLHLALALMLGLYIPHYLNVWYVQAASLLGG